MPAGGETLIAGQYLVVWDALALGVMEGSNVPTIEYSFEGEPVANTDAYGKSQIDGIYQGGNFFATMTCIEYRTATINAAFPYAAYSKMGIIGRLQYDLAAPLVFTAIAGTPAEASPATLTSNKAIMPFGFTPKILYGPTLRMVPLRFQLLPYTVADEVVWFVET